MALAAIALSACRSEDAFRASLPIAPDTLVAYDLHTGQFPLPNGLNTISRSVVPIGGSGAAFDIGFAIQPDGSVDVIPAREIISPISGLSPMVGIYTSSEAFEQLERAPEEYFRPDTTTNVQLGETFILQVFRNSGELVCYYLYPPRIYSKVVIDSVNIASGAIYLRQLANPNCGYRSLVPGLPAN